MQKRQFVQLTWNDAWSDEENFQTAHGIATTHSPMPVETMGWLIQDDDVGVSIACERSTEDGQEVFRGRTFVPRAMVKEVIPFNLTRPKKPKPKAPVSKTTDVSTRHTDLNNEGPKE